MAEDIKQMKKLYRSKQDRYISGVSGGLGEYFQVDANIFRILFIVSTFIGGAGILLYLTAIFIVPENPEQKEAPRKSTPRDTTFLLAIILIVVGLILLTKEFGLFDYFHFWRIPWAAVWALFLIAIGALLILSSNKKSKNFEQGGSENNRFPDFNKIYRSRDNRVFAGVCAGIADYLNIDPAIVRLLWVLASFASIGLGILVYVILIFVFPEKREEVS